MAPSACPGYPGTPIRALRAFVPLGVGLASSPCRRSVQAAALPCCPADSAGAARNPRRNHVLNERLAGPAKAGAAHLGRSDRSWRVPDQPEPQVAGRGVDGLGHARGGPVAAAVDTSTSHLG